MKNILVLPGTMWQLALIDKIREMGHRALVVNPAADSIGFSHADSYLQSDIFDVDRVVSWGKENHVNAVMSDECDIAMNLIAKLGKIFNVPTLDEETASLYTDKFLMREFSKKLGLKYPEYKYCRTKKDAIELLHKINGPIIIKPLDSNASHGVFKITTESELENKFAESLSFSRHSKCVLAERFINGVEFTIDGIEYKAYRTSGRYGITIGCEMKHPEDYIPSDMSEDRYNRVRRIYRIVNVCFFLLIIVGGVYSWKGNAGALIIPLLVFAVYIGILIRWHQKNK